MFPPSTKKPEVAWASPSCPEAMSGGADLRQADSAPRPPREWPPLRHRALPAHLGRSYCPTSGARSPRSAPPQPAARRGKKATEQIKVGEHRHRATGHSTSRGPAARVRADPPHKAVHTDPGPHLPGGGHSGPFCAGRAHTSTSRGGGARAPRKLPQPAAAPATQQNESRTQCRSHTVPP